MVMGTIPAVPLVLGTQSYTFVVQILDVVGVANDMTGCGQVLTVAWCGHRASDPGVIAVVLVGFGLVAIGAVGVLTGWKAYLSMVETSLEVVDSFADLFDVEQRCSHIDLVCRT